jgi:general secretion pathway protein L
MAMTETLQDKSAGKSALQRLDAWFGGPASLLAEWLSFRRKTRFVPARCDENGVLHLNEGAALAQRVETGRDVAPAQLSAVKKLLDGRAVSVRLPEAFAMRRSLILPVEAGAHLDGIVAARLAALSPLPVDMVLAGQAIAAPSAENGQMRVDVAIVPRAKVLPLETLFAACGVAEKRFTVDNGATADRLIVLRAGTAEPKRARPATGFKRLLQALTGLSVAAGIAALAGGPYVMAGQKLEADALQLRIDAARAAITAAIDGTIAKGGAEERALLLKGEAQSLALSLEDLALALPDGAHALEITFQNGQLTLSGRGDNVPAIVTALEQSGRFAQTAILGQARDPENPSITTFSMVTRPLALSNGSTLQAVSDAPTGAAP